MKPGYFVFILSKDPMITTYLECLKKCVNCMCMRSMLLCLPCFFVVVVVLFCFCLFFFFLGSHSWHLEVPRLGVKLALQLLAYTTGTAMPDLSSVCDLHYSAGWHQILNPRSRARDQTCILIDISWVRHC